MRSTTIPVTHSIVIEVAEPVSLVDATAFVVPSPIVSAVTSTLYVVILGCQASILRTLSTAPVEDESTVPRDGKDGGAPSPSPKVISSSWEGRFDDSGGTSQGEGMVQSGGEERGSRMLWSLAMVL